MKTIPLKSAVVGIGGFAGAHHTAWRELEQAGLGKLRATCDPAVARLGERVERYEFDARGVTVYTGIDEMLAAHGQRLDVLDIASPIRFHAEHHRLAVKHGLACYLEKPPTLDPEELEQMLAVEKDARFVTQVGFNYITQPMRQEIKRRLVAGEFGRLRHVSFRGAWRRGQWYYQRNNWAGRLLLDDGYLLLDSCAGNAMAHYLHNLLFHAGTDGQMNWAMPLTVEAELYRANPIEGADTVFARGVLDNGVKFSLAATHACAADNDSAEVLECDGARIVFTGGGVQITHDNGRVESIPADDANSGARVQDHLAAYCRYLAGAPFPPATRLADARPFVHLNTLLYLAAPRITTVSAPHVVIEKWPGEELATHHIPGIEALCRDFTADSRFPSERGVPWAGASGTAGIAALPTLRAAIAKIKATDGAGRKFQ